jgi:hypothetical protein
MTSTELLTDILRYLRNGWYPEAIAEIRSLANCLEVGVEAPSQPANRELPEAVLGDVVWAWTQDSRITIDKCEAITAADAFVQAVYIQVEPNWGGRGLVPVLSPIGVCPQTDYLDPKQPHWEHAKTREQLIVFQVVECAHRKEYQQLRILATLLGELHETL